MTKEEAIKYLQQLYPNGGHCWLDEQRIEAICMAINAMQEEPVSEGLEAFIKERVKNIPIVLRSGFHELCRQLIRDGAKWQKENLWKPADGDDLPKIDREVIVLCKNGRVAFGHRPVKKFMARPIGYGRTEEVEVMTYDKGGWNIPNVVWWLDCDSPKKEEI